MALNACNHIIALSLWFFKMQTSRLDILSSLQHLQVVELDQIPFSLDKVPVKTMEGIGMEGGRERGEDSRDVDERVKKQGAGPAGITVQIVSLCTYCTIGAMTPS